MAPTKFSDDELQTFLAEGRSQAQAARHYNVTESAISQRLRGLKGRRELDGASPPASVAPRPKDERDPFRRFIDGDL